jgi:hypothetical protein
VYLGQRFTQNRAPDVNLRFYMLSFLIDDSSNDEDWFLVVQFPARFSCLSIDSRKRSPLYLCKYLATKRWHDGLTGQSLQVNGGQRQDTASLIIS